MQLMDQKQAKDMKIYRVLILKRGHDIGSLKIIALNDSQVMRITNNLIQQKAQINSAVLNFRILDLGSFPYKGQEARVLSREGV